MTARVAISSKAKHAAAWLAPSVVAACGGALAAGAVEVRGDLDRLLIATAVIAPIAVPVLLIASLVARGLYAAWLPETLAGELREERGAMPRLAAWVGVVWLGLLGLAWAMFQGTWLLASWTQFKANSIGFLAPILAVLSLFVLLALSRPAAELFTVVARWIDRRWQRVAPGSLLRPPVIFIGAAITACVASYLIWILLVSRRLPDLSPGKLAGIVAGMATTALLHVAWRGPRSARAIGGGVITVATIAITVLGLRALHRDPQLAIAIWSDSRLARFSLERISDIEEIRGSLPVDRFKPIERPGVHRDLVLVTVDGLRADRTPPYNGPAAMPALAELGARGAVFEWAFAASSTERRTIPSLVTGVGPHRVRGEGSEDGFDLDPRHVAIAERLRAAGYQTAAFTCCFEHRAERTWLRGFEHRVSDADPQRLSYAASAWLKGRTSTQPMLLWLHLAVPWPGDHATGVAVAREAVPASRRLATFDVGLAAIDRALGSLVETLSARTVDRAPIVVVAGTRGEELGEHGQPFSTNDLFNTQIRVPLVVAGPSIRVQRVAEAVSIVDVAPSLVELASFVPPRGLASDGMSFAPLLTGLRSTLANLAFAAILPDRGPTLSAMMMVRGSWKLIDSGGTIELYDLKTDPDEKVNLASSRAQVVAELRALLTSRIRASQTPPF